LAFSQIATTPPNEIASVDINIQHDLVTIACDILLHHDRVRTGRNWCSGKNPGRFARTNSNPSINPCGLFADHTHAFARPARACHDGITIHGGIIETRHGQSRDEIFPTKTIERAGKRNCAFRQWPGRFENFPARFFLADHESITENSVESPVNSEQAPFSRDPF
jgi:hypothetical protein